MQSATDNSFTSSFLPPPPKGFKKNKRKLNLEAQYKMQTVALTKATVLKLPFQVTKMKIKKNPSNNLTNKSEISLKIN